MAADNIINLEINQKASFEVTFTIKDGNSNLNLDGYTVDAALKPDFETPDSQKVSFATSIASPPSSGQITISLTYAQTAALKLQRYYYDVNITSGGGFRTRVAEGTVKVSGGIS